MALTQVKPLGLDKPVDLAENEKIRLGTNNHLQIYHNAHSYIQHNGSGTEELLLAGNIISLNSANAMQYMIKATENGSVNLFYNGNSRIETTDPGATVTGKLVINQGGASSEFNGTGATTVKINGGGTGNGYCQLLMTKSGTATTNYITSDATIDFFVGNSILKVASDRSVSLPSSSSKLKIGSDGLFELSRDTGGSQIKNLDTNGQYLNLWTDDFWVGKRDGTANYIVANHDSGVDLFYSGSPKFETTSTGVKVTDSTLEIADSTCLIDLMETSATNHRIRNGNGNFYIQKLSDDKNTTTDQLVIDGGTGVVELYHSGNKKLETMSTGVNITGSLAIGNTSPTDLNSGANHLVIGGGSDSTAGMTIYTSTSGTGNIYFADGTSGSAPFAGYIQYVHNGNKMIFGPGAGASGTEMILDSDGKLGIGGTPTAKLYVKQSAASAYVTNENTETNSSYTAFALITPQQNFQQWISGPNNTGYGGANGCVFWETAGTGFHFYSSNNNLAVINSNGIKIPLGKGIHFSGYDAGGVSNLLDDYEEGTWTPAYKASGTDFAEGELTMHSNTAGRYTKIGNQVTVWMYLEITSINTSNATGAVEIKNLPFTSLNGGYSVDGATMNVNYYTGLTGIATGKVPSGYVEFNTTEIRCMLVGGNAQSNWAPSNLGAGGLFACATYLAA